MLSEMAESADELEINPVTPASICSIDAHLA